MIVLNLFFIGIDAFLRRRLTDGFQRRVKHFTCFRVCASRRRQAVDHQVNLTQVVFNSVNDLGFHLVGKRVAIEIFAVKPSVIGKLLERSRVVPTRCAWFSFSTFFLKEHPNRAGSGSKSRRNARGESVARRGAENQHTQGTILNRAASFNMRYLTTHILATSHRMCSGAKETADSRLDDHENSNKNFVNADTRGKSLAR